MRTISGKIPSRCAKLDKLMGILADTNSVSISNIRVDYDKRRKCDVYRVQIIGGFRVERLARACSTLENYGFKSRAIIHTRESILWLITRD